MSQQTSLLMGQRPGGRRSNRHAVVAEAVRRLASCYEPATLGNFRDPVKEIFYILLSARTSEVLYQRAHERLTDMFPTLADLAGAAVADVHSCIAIAGLGMKRAGQIVATATRLQRDFGGEVSEKLRNMETAEVFAYLKELPGLGPKSAFCIMMYALDIDVFPVDVNVQRVFERLGVLRQGLKHYQAQQIAPRFVPAGVSKEFHIALIQHGRRVCTPLRPRCSSCILVDICRHGRRVMEKQRERSPTNDGP